MLPKLCEMKDYLLWFQTGLLFLHQMFVDGHFASFSHFQTHYLLASAHFYRHLQFRHAVQAQFGSLSFLLNVVLLLSLIQNGPRRDLIGDLYAGLITYRTMCNVYGSKVKQIGFG